MSALRPFGPAFGRSLAWLAVLVLIGAAWIGVLWFGFRIDLSAHTFDWLAAAHLLPPVAAWLACLGVSVLRRRHAEAARRKAALQDHAARELRHEAAREAYRNHWAHRHASLDCRWIDVRELLHAGDPDRLGMPGAPAPGTTLSTTDLAAPEASDSDSSATPWPMGPLTEMLETLYMRLPAASSFGILLQGPAHQPFADSLQLVHGAHAAAMQLANTQPHPHGMAAPILALPAAGDTAVEPLIDLLRDRPELPGQVVIAFDSPARAVLQHEDDSAGAMPVPAHPALTARPGQALVVMVLTTPGLDAALQALEGRAGGSGGGPADPHVPHWDRVHTAGGLAEATAAWPAPWRTQMVQAAVLAYLRRPAPLEMDMPPPTAAGARKPARIAAWSGALAGAVDTALHNAALRTTAFSFEGDTPDTPDAPPAAACAWVVHDAGPVDAAGPAIAALSVALERQGIAPDPVRESTNLVDEAGDTGSASPWLMLALAGLRAHTLAQPVVAVAFGARTQSVGFVLPADTGPSPEI